MSKISEILAKYPITDTARDTFPVDRDDLIYLLDRLQKYQGQSKKILPELDWLETDPVNGAGAQGKRMILCRLGAKAYSATLPKGVHAKSAALAFVKAYQVLEGQPIFVTAWNGTKVTYTGTHNHLGVRQ